MTTPLVLCIMDGVGLNPSTQGNAWATAHTPNLDRLINTCPHSKIRTDGPFAGLPEGQMGNSEVGHFTMGIGRVVPQSLELLHNQINSGAITARPQWNALIKACQSARAVHLVGLLSTGGVHSHTDHAVGLLRQLSPDCGDTPIFVHGILDGRDTPAQAAEAELSRFDAGIAGLKNVHFANLCGRFYAMDRDQRWERTQTANDLYIKGIGAAAASWQEAVQQAYAADVTDEFIAPTQLPLPAGVDARIQNGDVVLCFNFRADRMRQFVRTLIDLEMPFERGAKPDVQVFTMTEYNADFNDRVTVMFPPEQPQNTLGEVVANAGLSQLRIAESEKYAHVTFFFNGGRETPFAKEERIVIPSPKVKTYDLQPEMNLPEVMTALTTHVEERRPDLIVFNIANGDQVGHAGVFNAAVTAMEAVDKAVGQLETLCQTHGYTLLLTADHGNVEAMTNTDNTSNPSHTTFPVPLIYVGNENITLRNGGLADIAPTCLALMGLEQPAEMEGSCLVSA